MARLSLLHARWLVVGVFSAAIVIALTSAVNAQTAPSVPDLLGGLTTTVVSETTTAPTSPDLYSLTVTCPAAYVATGGGAKLINVDGSTNHGGGVIADSYPVGNPPRAWQASASTKFVGGARGQARGITVYAVCARLALTGSTPTPVPTSPANSPTPATSATALPGSPTATPPTTATFASTLTPPISPVPSGVAI